MEALVFYPDGRVERWPSPYGLHSRIDPTPRGREVGLKEAARRSARLLREERASTRNPFLSWERVLDGAEVLEEQRPSADPSLPRAGLGDLPPPGPRLFLPHRKEASMLWKLRIGDAAFSAAPQIYIAQGFLAYARLVGGDQEVRALRYAIREGDRARIYAPWSAFPEEYADLNPDLRIRVEPIWIQGLPRFRVTLYLPAIRSGEEAWYFFLPFGDPAAEFARLVEAVTPYPVPDLSRLGGEDLRRRLIRDGVSAIPAVSGTGPEGFLIGDEALREILADLAR